MPLSSSALTCSALGAALALSACTPSRVRTKASPGDAINAAAARLAERNITLDPAGRRPTRLRTAHFCYTPPDQQGQHWDRSFLDTRPGPVGFSIEGPMTVQDAARRDCPDLFQADIIAQPSADSADPDRPETSLHVEIAWWRLHNPKCAPIGDPLLGQMRCDYTYRGSTGPEGLGGDAEGFFYGLLKGL